LPTSAQNTQEFYQHKQPAYEQDPSQYKKAEAFTVDFQGYELKKNKYELDEMNHQEIKKPVAFTLDFGNEAKKPEAFIADAGSPNAGD
jgi:hypothetical protein